MPETELVSNAVWSVVSSVVPVVVPFLLTLVVCAFVVERFRRDQARLLADFVADEGLVSCPLCEGFGWVYGGEDVR